MAYITIEQARVASRRLWVTASRARVEIRKSASLPMDTNFDISLSHAFRDAEVVEGVELLLKGLGFKVYVDWKVDEELDRSKVSVATAEVLRSRMEHCSRLLYAASEAASHSKWMPWELGYFDGLHDRRVGILPIIESWQTHFVGQEFIGLYPAYKEEDLWQLRPTGRDA